MCLVEDVEAALPRRHIGKAAAMSHADAVRLCSVGGLVQVFDSVDDVVDALAVLFEKAGEAFADLIRDEDLAGAFDMGDERLIPAGYSPSTSRLYLRSPS